MEILRKTRVTLYACFSEYSLSSRENLETTREIKMRPHGISIGLRRGGAGHIHDIIAKFRVR